MKNKEDVRLSDEIQARDKAEITNNNKLFEGSEGMGMKTCPERYIVGDNNPPQNTGEKENSPRHCCGRKFPTGYC